MKRTFRAALVLFAACRVCPGAETTASSNHLAMAREVTAAIQKQFWMPKRDLYRGELGKDDPAAVWDGGILFSMLVAATRHDPQTYRRRLDQFFDGLDQHWDAKAKIPGYEPFPTQGGNDKYYDDNAWLVITFAEAYELTGNPKFIRRSYDTLTFVMSGWDDTLGGGIWWHEKHKDDSKNTCINAPAAVGCLTMAKFRPDRRERMIERATETVNWTRKHLQAANGLFMDNIKTSGKINGGTLTYNSGLMLRAELMLAEATGDKGYLEDARRIANAADNLCHGGTLVYRDPPRWSHLMVEADLEYHRKTGDAHALERAKANADSYYKRWKEGKEQKLIDQASIARALWLMADEETEAGRAFWRKMDHESR